MSASSSQAFRTADLPQNRPAPFELVPEPNTLAQIATDLDLLDLRKLRFSGQVEAQGKNDFQLTATLGATVVQPCVVTLDPVTTRIDVPVRRLFVKDYQDPEGDEVEMPDDDSAEPLGDQIDLHAVMIEALSLALPAYPRAAEAELAQTQFAAPGTKPMSDDDARPFAGLAALKNKLKDS